MAIKIGCSICPAYDRCDNRLNNYKVNQCGNYIDIDIPRDLESIDEEFVLNVLQKYKKTNDICDIPFVKKCIDIIEKDLSKQLPQEVVKIYPYSWNFDSCEYMCPTCKIFDSDALMYDNNPSDGYGYCLCCGQKLNWSEK